uniref:Uncharacterized protein n=1 Tax=Anguilla anguilla TaxID=7936 RepID=A0A0E9T883_ANGAN
MHCFSEFKILDCKHSTQKYFQIQYIHKCSNQTSPFSPFCDYAGCST